VTVQLKHISDTDGDPRNTTAAPFGFTFEIRAPSGAALTASGFYEP